MKKHLLKKDGQVVYGPDGQPHSRRRRLVHIPSVV
jgi:hypothetical protein